MSQFERRQILTTGAGLLLGAAVAAPAGQAQNQPPNRMKVMVVGAHPDDPETGCGGTICRYTDEGHEVVVVYLTRGEGGIAGRPHDEAAAIRTEEATRACAIMKARPRFLEQVDGETEINARCYSDFHKVIDEEKPDLCFTHWPIDTHRDHRIASMLAYDAWLCLGRPYSLYYYEVLTGAQSQNFHPTHYIDISGTEERKRQACSAHASQGAGNLEGVYGHHDAMNRFRGMEAGCQFAEAFVRQSQYQDEIVPTGIKA